MRMRRRQRGFTLVEMIFSAALLAALAVTATYFWSDSFTLVHDVDQDSAAIAEGRFALERLAREIRAIRYDRSTGAYCAVTMSSSYMAFYKGNPNDTSSCGNANDTFVTISGVTPAGNQQPALGYMSVAAPAGAASSLLTGYASSTFGMRYLDADYAVINVNCSASNVPCARRLRYVEITVSVKPANGRITFTRTAVALRNQ